MLFLIGQSQMFIQNTDTVSRLKLERVRKQIGLFTFKPNLA